MRAKKQYSELGSTSFAKVGMEKPILKNNYVGLVFRFHDMAFIQMFQMAHPWSTNE